MLPVDSLKDFITEEPIASMDREIIVNIVKRREDYKTAKVENVLLELHLVNVPTSSFAN
jgi:hypothetical protein